MSVLANIKQSTVMTPLRSADKDSVLRELIEVLKNAGVVRNSDAAYLAVFNREQLGSTGLGEEIAIPHAKTHSVDNIAIAVGISPLGINFDSLDGKPVKIFFLILSNSNSSVSLHVEALSEIAKATKNKEFCQALIHAKNNEDLAHLFHTHIMSS